MRLPLVEHGRVLCIDLGTSHRANRRIQLIGCLKNFLAFWPLNKFFVPAELALGHEVDFAVEHLYGELCFAICCSYFFHLAQVARLVPQLDSLALACLPGSVLLGLAEIEALILHASRVKRVLLLLDSVLASKNNRRGFVALRYLLDFKKLLFKLPQLFVHILQLRRQGQLFLALGPDVLRPELVPYKPLAFLGTKLFCKHAEIVGLQAF